jgi:hypothetical protein
MNCRLLHNHPMRKFILSLILIAGLYTPSLSQKIEDIKFSYDLSGMSMTNLFKQAEANFQVRIFFKKQWVDTINVSKTEERRLIALFNQTLTPSGFNVLVKDKNIIIYPDSDLIPQLSANPEARNEPEQQWVNIGEKSKMNASKKNSLTGKVTDALGETLPGVTIKVDDSEGTTTGSDGYYSLELIPGNHILSITYVGFEEEERKIRFFSAGSLNINMFEQTSILDELVITEESAQERLENTSLGKNDLSIYTISKMPAFLGEADVIKSITALPGVTVTGESSSYVSVRGGNYDQNLILMNNIPIYNPSHLLGFFSVFNSELVSKVTLYKGSIPARYESRASAVLDVDMSPRAEEDFTAYGGIGILTSSLGIKGKLVNEKIKYNIGSRATYSDWILNVVPDEDAKTSSAGFRDISAVLTYEIDPKNNIEATFYAADDQFKFSGDTTYSYDQQGANLSYNHLFNNNLLYNLNLSHSNYDYTTSTDFPNTQFELNNAVAQQTIQNNVELTLGRHNLQTGIHTSFLSTNPGSRIATDPNSLIINDDVPDEKAILVSVYLEDETRLTKNIRLRAGLRFTNYSLRGLEVINHYEEGAPRNASTLIGQDIVNKGNEATSYQGLEPRISMSYITPALTLKIGYNRLYQFQHLLTNAISVTPLDQWKLADEYIKPVISNQASVGIFKNFLNNRIEASLEFYGKTYKNLIEYKNGANLVLNQAIEQDIISGEGYGYGLEFYAAKNTGDTKGWFSYTYSRTFIRTQSPFAEETINNGDWYPYYSDRPHNISISMDRKITNRWSMGANFQFTTGRPITVPQAKFTVDNTTVAYFSQRNEYRIPDYHRMDVSFTHENRLKKTQRFKSKWIISFYNIYARRNAYSIFFKDANGVPAQPYKLTVAGTIIPSVTYKFEFN